MKNFLFKSIVVTCVTGIAILLTPKASLAQVNMSLLTEIVQSCQKDVFSSQYYQQLGHQVSINPNYSGEEDYGYLNWCIESRYFHSLVISNLPWLASTDDMLPGYPGSVAVSQIAFVLSPNSRRLERTSYTHSWLSLDPLNFLDCLASQDPDSEPCSEPSHSKQTLTRLISLYPEAAFTDSRKLDLFTDPYDAFYAYICPSCYVAYNNYPSRRKLVGSFIEWFMKLEPSRRRELMSILGNEQTQENNRQNMQKEAIAAWREYQEIRKNIAQQEQEQKRRALFGE